MGNKSERVVIVEDAKGIAIGYETILEREGYRPTTCFSGEEVRALIDQGKRFDLAIVDIMLPTEDAQRFTLTECQDTGVRLIRQMIEKGTCNRFYVITVRASVKERIERLCEGNNVVLRFEHKLDHEPEEFAQNVAELLGQSVDGGERTLLPEINEHVDVIDGYAKMANLLHETDKEQLVASMTSIRKTLTKCRNPHFEDVLRRAESVLQIDYLPNAKGVLRKEAERTIAAIEDWLGKYT